MSERRILGMALAVLFASVMHEYAHAASCPPAAAAGPAKAVAGKPGEKGWLISVEPDDKGNRAEIWCLEAKAATPGDPSSHSGLDFAYRWISATGTDVWVGACTFGCGENKHDKQFEDKNDVSGSGKPNGIPDEFTKLTWTNVEKPLAGANDWEYSFNPATGQLTVSKTEGKWSAPAKNPLTGDWFTTYTTTKVVGTDSYAAPTSFSDLKYQGSQITFAPSGTDGLENGAFLAYGRAAGGALFDITLRAMEIGGSGSASDPFSGFATSIWTGDTFTIGGVGITSPFVGSLAAGSAYGGWLVDSYDTTYVTFRATADAIFDPGTHIPGFELYYGGTGGVSGFPWTVASVDENTSSSGFVIPEPPTLLLLLASAFAILSSPSIAHRRKGEALVRGNA